MTRWKKGLLACAVGLMTLSPAMAEPFNAKHIPAEAKWVVHVDIDAARKSSVWDVLFDKIALTNEFQASSFEIEEVTGVRLFDDLHDVTLFGPSYGEQEAVVLINARVDIDRLLTALPHAPEYVRANHGKHEVHSWKDEKNGKLFGALHGASHILISRSRQQVDNVLDLMDEKAKPIAEGSPLNPKIEPGTLLVMGVVGLNDAKNQKVAQSPLLRKSESAQIVLSEQDNQFVVKGAMATASPELAEQMRRAVGGIQALVALGAMNNPDDEKARLAADALSTLKATTRDKTLLLDMSVPSKTMKELIQSAQPPIESAKPRTVAPADDKGL